MFQVKVITAKVQNVSECQIIPSEVHIKLGMVMQHHEQECHVEKFIQYQGHSECLCNQNMTISTVSSKLLVRLHPNLV